MSLRVDWSLLAPALNSNIGGAFTQGFERGATNGALGSLARNPNDPRALGVLSQVNPQAAFAMQDQLAQRAHREAQTREQVLENRRNDIVMGASFLEGVTDNDGYLSALQRARTAGVNIEGAPEGYDPAYVDGIRRTAQSLVAAQQRSTARAQQPTNFQREYEYIARTFGPEAARDYLIRQTEPTPVTVTGPSGTRIIPRSSIGSGSAPQAQGAPQVGEVRRGYRFRGGDPASPQSWEPAEGGSSPASSGSFPDGQTPVGPIEYPPGQW